MILPDKNTPAGTPCWVRDNDTADWVKSEFSRAEKYGQFNWITQLGSRWVQCRLDDPYAPKLPEGFTPCNGRPEGLADMEMIATVLRSGHLNDNRHAMSVVSWNWGELGNNTIIGYKLIKKAPVPHVHHDKIVQWAADPSLKVWRQRQDGTWQRMLSVLWRGYEKYHIGEEPPPPAPRMLTIEGHTFAAPSPVQTETHTHHIAGLGFVRPCDVPRISAAKLAVFDGTIKEQLK